MKCNPGARLALVVAGLSLVLASCGGEETADLEVQLVRPPGPCQGGFPCAVLNDLQTGSVRIAAYNDNRQRAQRTVRYVPGFFSDVPSFGFGNSLSMTVEGFTGADPISGEMLASGATVPFAVSESGGPRIVRMFTTRTERFTRAFGYDEANPPGEEIVNADLSSPRGGHTLTSVPGVNGLVAVGGGTLVARGGGAGQTILGEVSAAIDYFDEELGFYYPLRRSNCDPAFEQDCSLRLGTARAFHTATALDDGRVIIAGGVTTDGDGFRALNSVEVITVNPERFEGTIETLDTSMSSPRFGHTATRMGDGRVVFVGGFSERYAASLNLLGSTEVTRMVDEIRPGRNLQVVPTGIEIQSGRALHAASFLEFQQIGLVITGGISSLGQVLDTAEVLFIGSSGALEREGFTVQMANARYGHRSVVVGGLGRTDPEQYLLVVGGWTDEPDGEAPVRDILLGQDATRSVEVLTTVANNLVFDSSLALQLGTAVAFPTVLELPLTRDVLVAGGVNNDGQPIRTAVRLRRSGSFGFGTMTTEPVAAGGLSSHRAFAPGAALRNHLMLISGGWTEGGSATRTSDYYNANDFQFIGFFD